MEAIYRQLETSKMRSFTITHDGALCRGNKFYMDQDEFPTTCGTSTEDYFGGAWNFEYPRGSASRIPVHTDNVITAVLLRPGLNLPRGIGWLLCLSK